MQDFRNLGNFKQKHKKFLNFCQNPHEDEITGGSSNPTEPPVMVQDINTRGKCQFLVK